MPMILGIDLGTAKSVIGIWQNQSPYIIPDRTGNLSIPSLVLFTPEGKIYVGNTARRHPEYYKGKNITISSVKRLLGKSGKTRWNWLETCPQEISAFILAELKDQAERHLSCKIDKAVIAIPSHFDDSQRRATKEAAEIAGLDVVRLLNEATAAALTYGFNKPVEQTILVFDFGGGTLDISILDLGEGIYQVKCIEGDSNLGGDDFDQVIMDYALDHIQNRLGAPIKLNPLQKTILKEAAEKAKIELSSKQKASIYIPGFLRRGGGHLDLDTFIDRKTFEELSKDLVERAIVLLRKALDSAHMEASQLDALLLLGGSSRIPYLRESIKKVLGIMPFTGVDIETCVAQGAIIQAAVLEGKLRDVLLLDVVPSSYGIRSQEDVFSKLIEKNTEVPTRRSQIFSTATNNQSEIPVEVYQGENEKVSQNIFLGTFSLTGIPPAPAGIPKIRVTFNIDQNMVIQVDAVDLGTEKSCSMKVEYPYGLDQAQISVMKKKVESWFSERLTAEIKSKIDTIRALIEKMLTKDANALSWEDISALKKSRVALSRIAESEVSYEELEKEALAAQSLYEKAHQKVFLHRKVTEDINNLIKKIEIVAPILRTYREEEARLLIQGRNLLEQYLEQNLSFEELHNIFFSVNSEYRVAASNLIIQALDDLAVSKDMKEWIAEIENIQFYPPLIFQGLQNLKEVKEVDLIVNLLELENLECRKSIQQIIFEKIRKNSHVSAYFLLIYSVFVDFDILLMVEDLYDEKVGTLLAFTLFSALNSNRISQKVSGAKIIVQQLPVQYLPEVVDYFSRESDNTVRRCLLDFIDKQPPGTLTEFFLNADHHIKSKIEDSKELLLRLAKEPDERISFFALDSLAEFSEEEIIPIFLSFSNSENPVIRAKSLQILIGYETKDTRVEETFIQAMRDPSFEIRLCALEFVEKTKKSSFIPLLFNLVEEEQNEMVKKKIVDTMGRFEDVEVVPCLLKLLVDNSEEVRASAISSLERNLDLSQPDVSNFFDLIRDIGEGKRSLSMRDKVFLWRFSKKHPEMDKAVQMLRKIQD